MWRKCNLFFGFITCGASGKETAAKIGDLRDSTDLGLIPGWGRSPGLGKGNPFQYSYLVNPMDRANLWATICRVAKSWVSQKQISTGIQFKVFQCIISLNVKIAAAIY